jgi:type IV secretion system protein VirB9
MKTLFLVASLLAGAAADGGRPNLAAPPKPNPTQTATAAAQVAGGPKPALKPELAKGCACSIGCASRACHPCHHSAPSPREAALHPCRMAGAGCEPESAMQEPQVQGFMNALQVYAWSDGVLYHLLTSPGRVSDIILQPGETITSIAAGDTARWTVGDTSSGAGEGKRVHILVKPFSAGLATNLVIATDRRTYHLQLTSTPGTAMAGLSWTYPADELLAIRRKEAEDKAIAPVATGLDIQRLSFAYVMTGDAPAWRPLRAFDDGRQTFIEFRPASVRAMRRRSS